jgi:hypothetical protein
MQVVRLVQLYGTAVDAADTSARAADLPVKCQHADDDHFLAADCAGRSHAWGCCSRSCHSCASSADNRLQTVYDVKFAE